MLHEQSVFRILLIGGLLIFFGCEDPAEETVANITNVNTLYETTIGNGSQGPVSEYFYNFDFDIAAEFYRTDNSNFDLSFADFLRLEKEEPPILTLKTFPEFLVDINPGEIEFTNRTVIDSLTQTDVVIEDSLILISDSYDNLIRLKWDFSLDSEFQRYMPTRSRRFEYQTTMFYTDTIDIMAYSATVDTPVIDKGIMYVDSGVWVDTSYIYESTDNIQFTHDFEIGRWQLNTDSLIFRNNTDCNDNGIWDSAEDIVDSSATGAVKDTSGLWYFDTGNSVWDSYEPFFDKDTSDTHDPGEVFQDRNCNGIWDPAEDIVASSVPGAIYDSANDIWFLDRGNGKRDDAERFTDLNSNTEGDPGELFYVDIIPNNLLVDFSDPANPRVILVINKLDSLVTRWGITYYNLIDSVDIVDRKTSQATLNDSIVTLFTNKVVADISDYDSNDDYLVTKTEWINLNPPAGQDPQEYDYLLFKQDENINKLVKPSYFLPYGFNNNFWYSNYLIDEVLYYTPNGLLRDGERFEESYYDSTRVAIYMIEKSFAVDADTVTVPANISRGQVINGNVVCTADTTWLATSIDECPGADTTFTDCFAITRELTMTMIGTGVEYGELNITWLAKGQGIVKDEVYIRWTERPGSEEQLWFGMSRWELGRITTSPAAQSNRFKQLVGQARRLRLDEFESAPELGGDPMHFMRTAGLQRVNITNK